MARIGSHIVPTALFVLALAGALGCSSAPRGVRPVDLFGPDRPASRVSADRPELPAGAATFALEQAPGHGVPVEAEALVASLFERRGWRRAESTESADVRIVLGDGSVARRAMPSMGSSGGGQPVIRSFDGQGVSGSPGYILNRGSGGSHRIPDSDASLRSGFLHQLSLDLTLEGGFEPAWRALAWAQSSVGDYASSVDRLAGALADRIPTPEEASAERLAIDRLGFDFLMLATTNVILEVTPKSAAARAGWLAGDRVMEIDGASVAGLGWGRIAARLAAAELEPIRVELLRSGERYLTFLVPDGPRRLD